MVDAPAIPEEILSPEEHVLLVAAAAAAECRPDAALSCFLTAPSTLPASHLAPNVPAPALLFTLLPRPRFPPALHAALADLVHPAAAFTQDLHAELRFHPAHFDRVALACAHHAIALPPHARALSLLAAALQRRLDAEPAPRPQHVAHVLRHSLWHSLHAFQRTGVLRAIATLRGRVLIADDMGMGKTLQALAVAQYYRKTATGKKPPTTLVLCPPTLRDSWKQAVSRWLPDVSARCVHAPASVAELLALARTQHRPPRDAWDEVTPVTFLVLSYDTVARLEQPFPLDCDIAIADEVHMLRNPESKRTAAVVPLLLAASVRVLVSGTPAQSRPLELYAPLYVLLHGDGAPFPSVQEFAARYAADGPPGSSARGGHAVNEHELHALLSAVMVRRLKAAPAPGSRPGSAVSEPGDGAGTDGRTALPPKHRVRVVFELPAERLEPVRRQLDASAQGVARDAKFAALAARTAELKVPAVLARLHAHMLGAVGLTRDEVDGGACDNGSDAAADGNKDNCAGSGSEKCDPARTHVLVFAQHLSILDGVDAWARRHDVPFVRIDGETPVSERASLVERFQRGGTGNEHAPGGGTCRGDAARLCILSLGVGAAGLTLTAADVVLFAELAWVPATLAQAEDRAHRIGRIRSVTVEYVVAPGSLDDAMESALARKARMLARAVDAGADDQGLDVLARPDRVVRLDFVAVERLVARSVARMDQVSDSDEDDGECGKVAMPLEAVTPRKAVMTRPTATAPVARGVAFVDHVSDSDEERESGAAGTSHGVAGTGKTAEPQISESPVRKMARR